MMQIYCKDLDAYMDLGGDTNFTFSLQNQWQHFYEEPEDYSFSTSIPNTENNLKIVRSGKFLSIVVDNYVVMDRFLCNLISTDLAQMEISLYRTRINKSFDVAEGGVSFAVFFKDYVDRLKNACKVRVGCRGKNFMGTDLNNAEFTTLYPYYNPVKISPVPAPKERLVRWTDRNDDEFYGDGTLTWLTESDIKVAEACSLNVPLRDVLDIVLGYIPEVYKNDDTAVRFPFDWTKFKLQGKIRIELLWGFRPNAIYYKPKYMNKWIYMSYNIQGIKFWELPFWKKFPFDITQDDFKFKSEYFKDKQNPYNILYTNTPILPLAEGIHKDRWFGGITNMGQQYDTGNGNLNIEFDVDGEYNFGSEAMSLMTIFPSMVLNMYWEELAKQLPLLCDYTKGVDTLFHNGIFYPNSTIIDYKETNTLDNDRKIRAFKFPFGGLNPYWSNQSYDYPVELQEITVGDIYVSAEHAEVNGNFPFLVTRYGNEIVRRVHHSQYKLDKYGFMEFSPISINTDLYCNNYEQNVLNTVELTCLGYEFQNSVIIGSRHFVVDKVETNDFKIFKLYLIEHPTE